MLYRAVTGEMAVKNKMWQGSSYQVLSVLVVLQLAKGFIVEVSLPKKGLEFANLIVDEETDDVYVQSVNSLLNYSPDLKLQKTLVMGPQWSSERCPKDGRNCTCPSTDKKICDKYYSYTMQDSWPAGFALDNRNAILAVCHSLNHGECRLVDLDNFEFLEQKADFIAINTAGIKRESQPKIMIGEGLEGMVVYYANSIISEILERQYGENTPEPIRQTYLATTRQLPSLQPLTFKEPIETTSNLFNLKMYKGLGQAVSLVPLHIFSHNGCTYFLSSDMHLVRVCQAFPTKHSVVMAFLNVGSDQDAKLTGTVSAHIGEVASDILETVEFTSNALLVHITSKAESYAATLVFTLDSIEEHFDKGSIECLQGNKDVNQYSLHDMEEGIQEMSCFDWIESNGGSKLKPEFVSPCQKPWNIPLMSINSLEPDTYAEYSSTWTVLMTTVIAMNTVVYASRFENNEHAFIMAGLVDQYVYDEKVMNEEVKLIKLKKDTLYLLTDNVIVKMKNDPGKQQIGCYRFLSCEEWKSSGTTLSCGFCLELGRVSNSENCDRESSLPSIWLDICPSVKVESPKYIKLEDYEDLKVEATLMHIEEVRNIIGSETDVSCSLNDGMGIYTAAGAELNGDIVTCSDFTSAAPNLPTTGYKEMNISVSLNDRPYGHDVIVLYSCNRFSNCSSCVRPGVPCSWCIRTHQCISTETGADVEDNCEGRAIVSETVEDPGRAMRGDVGWRMCPIAEYMTSSSKTPSVAVGETTSINVKLRSIGKGFDRNKLTCQFNGTNARILGTPALTPEGDYMMTCKSVPMSYSEDMPFKFAKVDVVDEFGHALDNPTNMQIEVYKCSSMVTTCGGCITLDQKYKCGWCAKNQMCTELNECSETDDTWLDGRATCPDPVISRFTPTVAPAGGGTLLTVHGSNLGTKLKYLEDKITVAGAPCIVQDEGFEASTSFVCKLGSAQMGQGQVEVTVNDLYTAKSEYQFTYVQPEITDISPKLGPVAGGTNVTVYGDNLHLGDNIMVRLNGTVGPATVIKKNSSHLVISTPKAAKAPKFRAFIEVIFDGTTTIRSPKPFEYVADPKIISMTPHSTILSGGTNIDVKGSGLNSVFNPRLVIHVGNPTQATKECILNSSQAMACNTPDIGSTLGVGNLPGAVYFDYGFIMDGVDSLLDVTDRPGFHRFEYHPDPTIEYNHEIVEYQEGKELSIKGRHLDVFNVVPGVAVTVGNNPCVVTNISATTILCKPPDSPEILSPDGHAVVIVQLGNYMEKAGAVIYPGSTDVTLVVAITLGVALPILLAVVIVVVCLRREHNKRKDNKPHRPPSAIELEETDAFIRHDMNSMSNRSVASNISRYVRGNKRKKEKPLNGAAAGAQEESVYEELDELQIMNDEHVTDHLLSKIHDEKLRDDVKSVFIPRERLVIGDAVGKGNFGRVYLAVLVRNREPERRVAVKTLQGESLDDETFEAFLQEGMRMKNFDHPHVLQLYGIAMSTEQYPMVVLPYMANGDLRSYVKEKSRTFTARELVQLGQQVAQGMAYLASLNCVHRDLAARNCMIDDEYVVKVADFGLSKHMTECTYVSSEEGKRRKMPIKWMALESLEEMFFTVKTDVWSYGILLWELMTRGLTPYPDVDALDVRDYLVRGKRLRQPRFCPDNVYQVMYRCWLKNPDERPTFADLVNKLELIINPPPRLSEEEEEEPIYMNVTSSDSAEYLNPVTSHTSVPAAHESVA